MLYIYSSPGFVSELGGTAGTNAALTQMRQACVNAGFAGLDVIAQYPLYSGVSTADLQTVANEGFDATWTYQNYRVGGMPTSQQQAVQYQLDNVNSLKSAGHPAVCADGLGGYRRAALDERW